MKNLKRYLTILSICFVILVVVIVIIFNIEKENKEIAQIGDAEKDISTDIEKLNDSTTYYSIEKMMNNFYLYVRVQNETAVYSLLNKEYTEQNDINVENVINKLSLGEESDTEFKVKEIYVKQDLTYPAHFVKVFTKEQSDIKLYYIFYMDNSNGVFAIQPITEQEYDSYVQGNSNFEIKQNKIEKNNYNEILRKSMQEEEKIKRFFDEYIFNALYNIEESYNSINEEYRQKRFGNIEEYKKYVNEKHEQLTSMDYNSIKGIEDFKTEEDYTEYMNNLIIKGLDKYQITRYEDYTQYTCVDDYGNYYIFNETTAFQYDVILDRYTVDLPTFIEKYNSSQENEKVLLNIQKTIMATKEGNYRYVYNKLDETFKSSNFKTQEDFEKYIKEKYNVEDKISYKTYEKINDIHVYDIEVTKNNGNIIKAQIVMQLKEGTDFVMSFSLAE